MTTQKITKDDWYTIALALETLIEESLRESIKDHWSENMVGSFRSRARTAYETLALIYPRLRVSDQKYFAPLVEGPFSEVFARLT
jgi:hypothetical protein